MRKLNITILLILGLVVLYGCRSNQDTTTIIPSEPILTDETHLTPSIPTENITYEILDLSSMNWMDENELSSDLTNPYRGEQAYTLSTETNKLSYVTPHKYDKMNALTLDLSNTDLTAYEKLVVTAKGDGVMRLIIESSMQILGGKNQIAYPLTIIEDTFEFSFKYEGYDMVLNSIKKISIIFGSDVNEKSEFLNQTPSIHMFNSVIEISKFEFTTEPSIKALTYNEQGFLYNPEDDDNLPSIINIAQDWNINDSGAYLVEQVTDGYQITTTTLKQEWSFISITLQGNYKVYTKIVIVVEGHSGAKFKMKLEGDGITTIETGNTVNDNILDPVLNGQSQTFIWNITQDNLPAGQQVMFLIFFEPGQMGTGAQMTIKNISLQK